MNLFSKTAIFSLLLIPTFAFAQSSAPPPPEGANKSGERMMRQFNLMDTNKDGFISNAEFKAFEDKKFTLGDTNKDGKLSQEEFEQMNARGKNAQKATQYP